MRNVSLILMVLITFSGLKAQIVLDTPMSDRITGYTIDVELDTEAKTVSGSMETYWVNPSEGIVSEIHLHMYLNAFRSNKSTFYRESGGAPGHRAIDYGWVDISSIFDAKGNNLLNSMTYIQPDDNNPDDMTVLRIELNEPASPEDTVWLSMEFTSKLPSNIIRTGFRDDYFFVAQWFPKFGVYEPVGMRYAEVDGWNCHQFHGQSEFYANHSVYDVSITLPEEYIVGSGGMLIREEVLEGGLKKVVYRAEDIVDFAWTAWPEYLVATDEWEHVAIRFLYSPGREDQVERQMTAVKYALEYFAEHVGPFPWPHLTFVDPPSIGAGSGGMEYTTIFTSGSSPSMPEYLLSPEMVTVHEFGHAYFMGILANNEFEEPWIDEGINSYFESRIMDHYYGPDKGYINHKQFGISDKFNTIRSYNSSGDNQVINNSVSSWEYPHGTYGMMSYSKAATWLWTLHGILGEETTDDILKEYYNIWGFKHPSAEDFIDIVNKVVTEKRGLEFGENMDWFFEQTLYGTGICDYKVDGIIISRIRSFKGLMKSDTGMVLREDPAEGDTLITSTVKLQRRGEVMLPVEILVHFENGEEVLEKWDGKSRYKNFEYTGTEKVLWAKIDPEGKLAMDVDIINNSYTTKPDRVPVKTFFRKASVLVQFLIQFITL